MDARLVLRLTPLVTLLLAVLATGASAREPHYASLAYDTRIAEVFDRIDRMVQVDGFYHPVQWAGYSEVVSVAFQPPEPEQQPVFVPPRRAVAAGSFFSLASVPNMIGDFFPAGGVVVVKDEGGGVESAANLPSRRFKFAENNRPIPTDRVFFTFNHFHNAASISDAPGGGGTPVVTDYSISRYTLGMEKTFAGGLWSVEGRLAWDDAFTHSGSAFGSLATSEFVGALVAVKRLIYMSNTTAVGAGLAVRIPTSGAVTGAVGSDVFSIHDDAVILSPYLGIVRMYNQQLYYHVTGQLDIPLNGDRIVENGTALGRLNGQTLFLFDAAAGYWIYQRPGAYLVKGVSAQVEFHYSTALQDPDSVFGSAIDYSAGVGRLSIPTATIGVHTIVGAGWLLHVAAAFPLQDERKRPFDAEIVAGANWFY